MTVSLADVRAAFTTRLHFAPEDIEIIDVSLATFIASRMPGEPLWVFIVAPPSSGKTEIIRSMRGIACVQFISTISPKTLISGFRPGGRDYSLLPKLDGKLLAIKDLTAIIDMPAEQQRQIFGTLRDAYDGFSDHGRGTMDMASYDAKFGLLAGVTNVIDLPRRIAETELGDRYLKARFHGTDRKAAARKARANHGLDDQMRREIANSVRAFLRDLSKRRMAAVGEDADEELIAAADWVAVMRTVVPRDHHHRVILAPSPESPARLVKQLTRLVQVVATIRAHNTIGPDDLDTVWRVAADTVPPLRLRVFRALEQAPDGLTVAEISRVTRLAQSAVSYTAEDMWTLDLLDRQEDSPKDDAEGFSNLREPLFRYKIREDWRSSRKAG